MRRYIGVIFFSFLFFPLEQLKAQSFDDYFIEGMWHRNDEKIRNLKHTDYGILLGTSFGEYEYYRIEKNEYQMKWRESPSGNWYRWTLKVIDDGTIRNYYEVKNRSIVFYRVYKKLEL